MLSHYQNDSSTGEWLLLSADLEHVASGVCVEYRDGRVIVDGVVSVNSMQNATELLQEIAA